MKRRAGRLLWDDPNPWRQAWQSVRVRGLVPLKVPQRRSRRSFHRRRRPGARRRSIATGGTGAAPWRGRRIGDGRNGRGWPRLDSRTPQGVVDPIQCRRPRNRSPNDPSPSKRPASRRISSGRPPSPSPRTCRRHGAAEPHRRRRPRASRLPTTRVVVPLPSLEDWVRIRKRLQTLPQVQSVTLQSITREEARLTIVYPGNTEQLSSALAQSGLYLRDQDGEWVITTDASASEPAGAEQPRDEPGAAADRLAARLRGARNLRLRAARGAVALRRRHGGRLSARSGRRPAGAAGRAAHARVAAHRLRLHPRPGRDPRRPGSDSWSIRSRTWSPAPPVTSTASGERRRRS